MKNNNIYTALLIGALCLGSCMNEDWQAPDFGDNPPYGNNVIVPSTTNKITIADLKAKVESLVTELSAVKAELAQYKSVRGKLRTADLEQENDRLRSRLRTYEDVISRNNLWHFFNGSRNKNRNRDDAR